MKVVVIGGTGLIGSNLVKKLRDKGHEVIAASPSTGVNTITGEGLAAAFKGANVVVDVANSPSFEDKAVLEFFETSGHNIIAAEKAAGVKHHIALSIVGTDLLPKNGYFRAKVAQENLIKASSVPYTIVRATQFFEFLGSIIQISTVDQEVHLSPAFFQPIASEDVASALLKVVSEAPINGVLEIAGPERFRLSEIAETYLKALKDPRKVISDIHAQYYGSEIEESSLIPRKNPRLGSINFKTWLAGQKMK